MPMFLERTKKVKFQNHSVEMILPAPFSEGSAYILGIVIQSQIPSRGRTIYLHCTRSIEKLETKQHKRINSIFSLSPDANTG